MIPNLDLQFSGIEKYLIIKTCGCVWGCLQTWIGNKDSQLINGLIKTCAYCWEGVELQKARPGWQSVASGPILFWLLSVTVPLCFLHCHARRCPATTLPFPTVLDWNLWNHAEISLFSFEIVHAKPPAILMRKLSNTQIGKAQSLKMVAGLIVSGNLCFHASEKSQILLSRVGYG